MWVFLIDPPLFLGTQGIVHTANKESNATCRCLAPCIITNLIRASALRAGFFIGMSDDGSNAESSRLHLAVPAPLLTLTDLEKGKKGAGRSGWRAKKGR